MKLADLVNGPWMITPDMLGEIQNIYSVHMRGEKIDLKAVEASLGRPLDNEQKPYDTVNGTAVIPIQGTIAKKMNLFSRVSGGTSSQLVQQQIQAALDDPYVDKLLLYIDSPGGAVDGTFELADYIYGARGQKPIDAFTDGQMASAAYLIGSAADRRFISSEATDVGSIGVITKHVDVSKAEEMYGQKTTVLTAGKYKGTGHRYAPLSEQDQAVMQGQLDHLYSAFVDTVARNLGISAERVVNDMAEGREFMGSQAIKAGLVDGMATMDEMTSPMNSDSYQNCCSRMSAGAAGTIEATAYTIPEKAEARAAEAKGAEMTREELQAQHPQLCQALIAEGMQVGAQNERQRIMEIQALPAAGHKEIIQAAIEDGTSSAGDVALAVMNREKALREGKLSGMIEESIAPAAESEAKEVTAEQQKTASLVGAMVNFAKETGRA